MLWYTKTTDETLQELQTTTDGLSADEAKQRLERDGPNKLTLRSEPLWKKIIEPFANVFVGVLLVAAALSLATGHALDAVIIGVIIAISATIYYVQSYSTERVLRALRQTSVENVHVYRDGASVAVSVEELVVGDVVALGEGEKVPADMRVLRADNTRADEAMLTGESLPISKKPDAIGDSELPVYEQKNMLFQGSFIVSGHVRAVVVAVAGETEYGKLADLATPAMERSPTQQKIDKLIQQLIIGIAIVTAIVLALELWRGIELLEALRFVMAMAVSAVPEGLPVAITVVMVLGMRRMAKHKALARSMKAVETTGVITTIATDKTGTLTKNKLRVQEVWQPEVIDQKKMAQVVALSVNDSQSSSDPLDIAMRDFAEEHAAGEKNEVLERNLPFDQDLAMSGATRQRDNQYITYVKGAPEKIIALCYEKDTPEYTAVYDQLQHFTQQGYRVIALAHTAARTAPEGELADITSASCTFDGLVAVADELRPEAKQAITAAQDAGITVRMITGDHAETAFSIGRELGLASDREQVLDCRDIDNMDDDELRKTVQNIRVFARVVPKAKHRILTILKQDDITAMTGDGVNDVPALTNAHLGIAMGSGAQIAKEAGDIVLLDDNFASVVQGVEGGRVIFDNIRRMVYHMLTTSLGEVLVFIIALVVGLPLPVVAVQILWINLVTDTAFDIPLGLEPAEDDVMKRKPRLAKQGLLDRHIVERFILLAVVMSILTVITFWYFLQSYSLDYARTIAFTVLVVVQWANAINARSELSSFITRMRTPNWAFVVGFSIAVALQLLVLFGPLADVMYVVPVALEHLVVPSLIGFIIVLIVGEAHKWYSRRTVDKRGVRA